MRLRTAFVSRPPRLDGAQLADLWRQARIQDPPVVPLPQLIELKKTDRERDYVIIGSLAQQLTDPVTALLAQRSPARLRELARQHADLLPGLVARRPLLLGILDLDEDAVAVRLDAERRALMRANIQRLDRYRHAATAWRERWTTLEARISAMPLPEAHALLVDEATPRLPTSP
jgi:hypothetical protein